MGETVAVIIPTYYPGEEFGMLLERLAGQTVQPNRIVVMNTEKAGWNSDWERICPMLEVVHLTREEFDHAATRSRGAVLCSEDVMVFMTQDALPADRRLLENLIAPLSENPKLGAAYARQLPKKGCAPLEKITRAFNYPETSSEQWEAQIPKKGIKAFFCSNVCAAYRRSVFEELGGFCEKAIFNEDMIFARGLLKAGYGIAYAADARVYHSHNYGALAQFHRNFDLGVSQAEHPEIFAAVPSEKEGVRLIKRTGHELRKLHRLDLFPYLIWISGWKYLGYLLGKRYKRLPKRMIAWCTMNKAYWKKEEKRNEL